MKKPFFLWLPLLIAGCIGTNFSFDNARRIHIGMTSEEVQRIMGKPFMVSTTATNEIWVYSYASGFGAVKSVSYMFDRNKVKEVPLIPDSFK